MKLQVAERKHPDCLADFLNINQLAARSSLSKCTHRFFHLPDPFFSHLQALRPSVQIMCDHSV